MCVHVFVRTYQQRPEVNLRWHSLGTICLGDKVSHWPETCQLLQASWPVCPVVISASASTVRAISTPPHLASEHDF